MNGVELMRNQQLEAFRVMKSNHHAQKIKFSSKYTSSLPSEYDAYSSDYSRRYNQINKQSNNKTKKTKERRTKVSPVTSKFSFSEKSDHSNRFELVYSLSKEKQMAGNIKFSSERFASLPSEYDASSTKYSRRYSRINEQFRKKTGKAKGMRTKVSPVVPVSFFSEKNVYSNRFEVLYSLSKGKQMAGKKRREDIMNALNAKQ